MLLGRKPIHELKCLLWTQTVRMKKFTISANISVSMNIYIYIYKCRQSDRAKDKSSIDILNFYKAKDSDRERDAKHISLS
jgi:hypothetical protein